MPQINSDDFAQSTKAYLDKVAQDIYKDVVAAGLEVRNGAIRRSPVDTGNLRAGWQSRQKPTLKGGEVEIFNPVPYAGFVEYGTRYQKAQPMLRPSLAEAIEKLKQKLRRYGK